MCDDRLKILDTDDNVKLFRNIKLTKFQCVYGDRGVQWLLEDLCCQVSLRDGTGYRFAYRFQT